MQDNIRKKDSIKSIIVAMSVSILIIILAISICIREKKNIEFRNKLAAMNNLIDITDSLRNSLDMKFRYADFFRIVIKENKDISEEEFNQYAELIFSQSSCIKSIAITKDFQIKYIYPLESNKDSINKNLMTDPKCSKYVKEAIEKSRTDFMGHLIDKSGVTLVEEYIPIYVSVENEEKLWGMSSITLDFNNLMEEIDIKPEKDSMKYALRISSGQLDDDSQYFYWGNKEIFNKDSIVKKIDINNSQWEYAIYPEKGWVEEKQIFYLAFVLGAVVSSLAFICVRKLAYIIFRHKSQAVTDSLTGVMNRRRFYEFFLLNIQNRKNRHIKSGILVIDIDDFKKINDCFGHQTGDLTLIHITDNIRSCIEKHDIIARIGGDEFVVFIHHIGNREELNFIAEGILKSISAPIEYENVTINVSVSIGGAVFPDDGITIEKLFEIADAKMYESKKNGKNQFNG